MAKTTSGRPRGTTLVDVHIGQKIRTRRNLLGLSQTDLADAAFQTIDKRNNALSNWFFFDREKGAHKCGALTGPQE